MLLFFDTETTGLPDRNAEPEADHQPDVVQLAAILCELDGREVASINLIVNCEVEIPDYPAGIHGITTEIATRCGVKPKVAAAVFGGMAAVSTKIIAHNIPFDLLLMDTMSRRYLKFPSLFPATAVRICTMKMADPFTKIPPTTKMVKAGFTKTKAPRLEEAYKHFFGKELIGAHDALIDVRACKDIYFHMLQSDKSKATN